MGKRKVSEPVEDESVDDDWYKPEVPVEEHEIVPSDPDDVRPFEYGDDGWVYVLHSVNQKKQFAAAKTLQACIRRWVYVLSVNQKKQIAARTLQACIRRMSCTM